LLGDADRVVQLLVGVRLQFGGDALVLRAFDLLAVDDVLDGRFVFARQIVLQPRDQFRLLACILRHAIPSNGVAMHTNVRVAV